jgi:hypothetical protein
MERKLAATVLAGVVGAAAFKDYVVPHRRRIGGFLAGAVEVGIDLAEPLLDAWYRRRLAETQRTEFADVARLPFHAAIQYPPIPPLISSSITPALSAPPTPVIEPNAEWRDAIVLPSVILVIGKRGSGKTATAYKVLEINRYSRSPYVVGVGAAAQQKLPDWIGLVDTIEDLPPKSIALIDESYLQFHSRESMSPGKANLSRVLNLSRQKDQTLIFVSQEARQVDKNIASSSNVVIVKDTGMLQVEFDRPELRRIVRDAEQSFEAVRGDKRRWSYVYSPDTDFAGMLTADLPSFWKPSLSRLFTHSASAAVPRDPERLSRDQRAAKAKELRSQGHSFGQIASVLGVSKATVVNYVKGYPYR